MIAGSHVSGQTFVEYRFNDKVMALAEQLPTAELSYAFLPVALGPQRGALLPTLNLPRVFVLTTGASCSASEAIINGLRPYVQVVQIGSTTCGKPYGFFPKDNCGTTYFPIEVTVANAQGFSEYADGLAPSCVATDDLTQALGDPLEASLAAALDHRASGQCPPSPSSIAPLPGPLDRFEALRAAQQLRATATP